MEVSERDKRIRERLQGAMKKLQANHATPLFVVGVRHAPRTDADTYVFCWPGDESYPISKVHDLLKSMFEEVCEVMKIDPKGVN